MPQRKNPAPTPAPRRKGLEEVLREKINDATVEVAEAGCNAVDDLMTKGGTWLKRKLLDGLTPQRPNR